MAGWTSDDHIHGVNFKALAQFQKNVMLFHAFRLFIPNQVIQF
jgi:hypothetical protein